MLFIGEGCRPIFACVRYLSKPTDITEEILYVLLTGWGVYTNYQAQ